MLFIVRLTQQYDVKVKLYTINVATCFNLYVEKNIISLRMIPRGWKM